MGANTIFSYNWSYLLPEFTVLGFATVLSLLDLFLGKHVKRSLIGWLSLIGVLLAGYFVLHNVMTLKEPMSYMADMFRIDHFGSAFKLIFLGGMAFTLLLSLAYNRDNDEVSHQSEYYYLLLTGLLGAMVMASSGDMITLFVGLELLSLSSYVLVGLRKQSMQSNESAMKYVVSGGIATAVTLFGMSYLYGLTGATNLFVISQRVTEAYASGFSFLVILSFVFIVAGLAFKISVVPNHLWTPDVYQGAPTPVTAFLAVVSKAAGFALIFRFLFTAYIGLSGPSGERVFLTEMSWYLSIIAGLSMIIGNTMALRQTNVKRLMAYSGVAQAGYLLVPFVTLTQLFFEQSLFYLFAYLLVSFGAFAVIMVVTRDQKTEDIKSFAGLYHRAPFVAIAMTFFLLSLAGIPISAGFFGKFYLFMSAIFHSSYVLSGIMIATSVISYFYYFGFIRQMYMRPGMTEAKLKVPAVAGVVIVIAVLGTIVFGIVPGVALDFLHTHFNPNFDFGGMQTPSK